MRAVIKLMPHLAAVIVLLGALAPPAQAQQGQPRPIGGGRRPRDAGVRVETERDFDRDLGQLRVDEANRQATRRSPRLRFAQISDDFKQLQLVNIELAQAVQRGGTLDLKFIAKSAGEIKKRASRLRDNLILPEMEKATENPQVEIRPETGQLKSSLSVLDKLILKFVYNPVFQEINVVDAQHSVTARRDLENIILLSEQVKKASEKLNKMVAQR